MGYIIGDYKQLGPMRLLRYLLVTSYPTLARKKIVEFLGTDMIKL